MPQHPIDLRLLQYFLTTAEAGGITRAAAMLNVAQPTLSKAIRLLEYQLDVTLFERGPHGVVPTAIGARLLDHARNIVAQVHGATADIEGMRTGEAGTVHIGAGPSWVRRMLPEAVAEAIVARPDLQLNVHGGYDETLLDRLVDGELDMVVAELPLDERHSVFEVERLTEDFLVVCARAGHPLAGRKGLLLADVLGETWVLPAPNTLSRQKFEAILLSLGLPMPAAVVNSNSLTFILTLVSSSDVLTYTTRSSLLSVEAKSVVEIDVPQLRNSRTAGLIFRRPRILSPAAAYIVELLHRQCQGRRN